MGSRELGGHEIKKQNGTSEGLEPIRKTPLFPKHTPRITTTDRPTPTSSPKEVTIMPFPTDAMEQRGNILLSTNLGPKSHTIQLLPPDGSMIAKENLSRTFAANFKGTDIAGPRRMENQPTTYCETALVPHGLVAREFTITSGASQTVVGYGLTEAGQQIGRPGSALAIDYEDKTGKSLFPQLGPINTNTPDGARAPVQRATMLEVLAAQDKPMSLKDFRKETGMLNKSARGTIEALAGQGLVAYDSESGRIGKKRKGYTLGETPVTEVESYLGDTTFSSHLLTTIQAFHRDGKPINQEALFHALPDDVRARSNETHMRERIRRHVGNYVRQGALTNISRSSAQLSDLVITDAGKQLVEGYIHAIDKLIAGDAKTHAKAADIMARIQQDPVRYAQRTAKLYYPHSRRFQLQQHEEKLDKLAIKIGSHPEGVVVSNLVGELDILPTTTKKFVDILQRRGIVDVEIVRGARVVRLRNTPPEKR